MHHQVADGQATMQAVLICGPKMDTAVKTAHRSLSGRSGEAIETAMHAWQKVRAGGKGDIVSAVENGQDGSRSAAEGAMAGHVIRERRRYDQRTPTRVRFRRRVAIGVCVANGRHRSPEAEAVFGVPGADGGIGHSQVQQGKQARIFLQRIAFGRRYVLGYAVPVAWRCFSAGAISPEQGYLGLVGRAGGVGGSAHLFDFIYLCSVPGTGKGGRSRRTELGAGGHAEWPQESPLRQQIGSKDRRGGHPRTGPTADRRRDGRVEAVRGACGQGPGRNGFTPGYARLFLRVIWQAGKVGSVDDIESGLLSGK